jgi:hypothetical protein
MSIPLDAHQRIAWECGALAHHATGAAKAGSSALAARLNRAVLALEECRVAAEQGNEMRLVHSARLALARLDTDFAAGPVAQVAGMLTLVESLAYPDRALTGVQSASRTRVCSRSLARVIDSGSACSGSTVKCPSARGWSRRRPIRHSTA